MLQTLDPVPSIASKASKHLTEIHHKANEMETVWNLLAHFLFTWEFLDRNKKKKKKTWLVPSVIFGGWNVMAFGLKFPFAVKVDISL